MKFTTFLIFFSISVQVQGEDLSILTKSWQEYISQIRKEVQKDKPCDLMYISIRDDFKHIAPDLKNPYEDMIVSCIVSLTTNSKPACRSGWYSLKRKAYKEKYLNEVEGFCNRGGFEKLVNAPMGNSKEWTVGRYMLDDNPCKLYHRIHLFSFKPEYRIWLEENSKKYFDKCITSKAMKKNN